MSGNEEDSNFPVHYPPTQPRRDIRDSLVDKLFAPDRGEGQAAAREEMNFGHMTIRIPKECEPYAKEIRLLFDAMVVKLVKNAHKGKWEDNTALAELVLLRDEVVELTDAVASRNAVEVLLEAADVANFALIIASCAMEGRYK